MARIRSIKPEFWSDPDMMKLSVPARLLYIGMWNFADDNGVLDGEDMSLKAKIFPMDRMMVSKLVDEIVKIGKAVRYQAENKPYIWLKNLKNHQIIDRPRKSLLPLPNEDQMKSVEISLDRRDRKGKEGEEGASSSGNRASPSELLNGWNNNCGGLPKAKGLSGTRAEKCRTRLSERPLNEWVSLFSRMAKTPFLNGKNDRGWRASFDWIIENQDNALKVMEGKYDSMSDVRRSEAEIKSQEQKRQRGESRKAWLCDCHNKPLIERKPGHWYCPIDPVEQEWALGKFPTVVT